MKRRYLTVTLALAAMALFTVIAIDYVRTNRPDAAGPATVRTTGKALVGGAFSLVDHTGRRVTDADYRGKYLLVFFGYTYCPDVCPAELQVMTLALDLLGDKADRIQPLFITIDPQRDTVDRMKDYVGNFYKTLVGLTGTPEEIAKAAKAYRVYYKKAEVEDDDYLMDHTSIVYLMDPEGEFIAHFPYGVRPEKMAARIATALK